MCERLSEKHTDHSGLDQQETEPWVVKKEAEFSSSGEPTGPFEDDRWNIHLRRYSRGEFRCREDGEAIIGVKLKSKGDQDIEDDAQEPTDCTSTHRSCPASPLSNQQGSLSPDSDTDDSEDWMETGRTRSRPGPAGERINDPSGIPLSCTECGKIYKYKLSLVQHRKTCEGKQSSCPFCNKIFSHHKTLKEHLNFHTGDKLFPCKLCEMKFTKQVRLNAHMRTHTGEKPFCCTVCGKCFPKSDTLKRHMRCHTGEKPVSCSICGRSFTENSNLKNHMRIHTGEKPYSCSVCGRSFPKSDSLKRHMKIHTGATPVLCSLCGKSFTERGNLKRHMKTHAEVKVVS